jgi:hypothetical protein
MLKLAWNTQQVIECSVNTDYVQFLLMQDLPFIFIIVINNFVYETQKHTLFNNSIRCFNFS